MANAGVKVLNLSIGSSGNKISYYYSKKKNFCKRKGSDYPLLIFLDEGREAALDPRTPGNQSRRFPPPGNPAGPSSATGASGLPPVESSEGGSSSRA